MRRVASAELLPNQRQAVQVAGAKTVAAVEKLARARLGLFLRHG
jgi:hypothetical protein